MKPSFILATFGQQEQSYQAGPHGSSQYEREGHHQGSRFQLPDGPRQGILREGELRMMKFKERRKEIVSPGYAGREKGHGRTVCDQDSEEGHHHSG